jgi:uncharacterized membrane protein
MFRRIDESKLLLGLLERLSNLLAKQRGLPVVIGILLILMGFVLQIINVAANNNVVELVGVISHNAGVLIALIGLTLSIPLGK